MNTDQELTATILHETVPRVPRHRKRLVSDGLSER